jgi:hypothetical protein
MAHSKHNGNGHRTETPDVSHIKNPDVTHEASDISVSGVLKFVAGLTVLCVVVFVLMWGLFRFLNAQETEKEPDPGPMAMNPEQRLPPEPRLQAARGFGVKLENGEYVNLEKREPEAEFRVLRQQWDQRLECRPEENSHEQAGHTDARPCVPIDTAINKLIEGGTLRSRESAGSVKTGSSAKAPTAWSSGRE